MTKLFKSTGTSLSWSGDDLSQCPWERLEVVGRVRCWECRRELEAAAKTGAGIVPQVADLNPRDRGALKKLPDRPALREGPGISNDLGWDD